MARSGPQGELRPNIDVTRCDAFVQLAESIVRHESLHDLLRDIFSGLQNAVSFDIANFSLHDPTNFRMHLHSWDAGTQKLATRSFTHQRSLSEWVWEHQKPLLVPDLRLERRVTPGLERLRRKGILSYCVLPVSTDRTRLGVLGLGSRSLGAYSKDDLRFVGALAAMMSVVLENLTTRQLLRAQKQHLRTLVDINRALVVGSDLAMTFPSIAELFRRVAPVDLACLRFSLDAGKNFALVQSGSGAVPDIPEAPLNALSLEILVGKKQIFFHRNDPHMKASAALTSLFAHGLQAGYCLPLATNKDAQGTILFATTQDRGFDAEHLSLLQNVAVQLAIALDNARSYSEIALLTDRLAEEKLYLQDEIRTERNFSEIVGDSHALKELLSQVSTVAPKDATVLILGETGTGKELIARAVHRESSRRDRTFIKLNCAAIPTGLLESELFGHEKGSFTGAISQKVGRLELADGGTLFLDEVGDIPLELQPKLLRVLQDQEFERLGSNRTLKVNIRVIAATNRNLAKLVQLKEFRSDLFYRLSVFPIHLPPLRERRSDIPLLVRFFADKYARRMDKVIDTIPTQTMKALREWSWPGNIRELENFIERSVILTESNVLHSPLNELSVDPGEFEDEGTLEQAERKFIVKVLQETRGLVSGPRGAAAKLGLKRTTLQSRIRKLEIDPSEYGR